MLNVSILGYTIPPSLVDTENKMMVSRWQGFCRAGWERGSGEEMLLASCRKSRGCAVRDRAGTVCHQRGSPGGRLVSHAIVPS